MPNVVVSGGVMQCSHKGTLQLSSGDSRLEISGAATLTKGMEVALSFAPGAPGVLAPCPYTSPSSAPSPCTATLAATSGVSSQLTVGALGVLLDNASGQATNANDPSATWSIADAGQTLISVDQ
jgi:hypothetical protein